MSNSTIWPIDRTISGATTPCQSGPGSNVNDGVYYIPQSSSITEAWPSDCLVSFVEGVQLLCGDAVGVFYSPRWLGQQLQITILNTDNLYKITWFQAAVILILLYGCTTRTLTKRMKKKLDSNYTRMLQAILNKSWRQHPTKQQLYGHLPPIMKTIQVRRTRHVEHCWRNRDELISDILLWTPSHGRAKAEWPARTYIQQLCADTGCSLEDLQGVMDDREGWQERVKEIRTGSMTWWCGFKNF